MSIDIQQRAKKVIAEILGVGENDLKAEQHLTDDLGGDSLDAIELVMALEDEFNLEIPESAAGEMNTVQDIFNWLEANVKS